MAITFRHIHIKSTDPRKTAKWYVDNLSAKIIGEMEIDGGLFVRMELAGVPFNISSRRSWEKLGPATYAARYGLEHFALSTDDFDNLLPRLTAVGAKVLHQYTNPSGLKVAFIRTPDKVRIEIVEALAK